MAGLTVAQRAVGAVVGTFVADAAGLPLHWIYDVSKIDDAIKGKDPEFHSPSACPYYHLPTGHSSCYADQAFVVLESLTKNKGFNKTDYKQSLYEAFGPTSAYEGTLGRPATKEDLPVNFPWRNQSLHIFLQNYQMGKEVTGADDKQADGFAKVPAIVALYAGTDKLETVVREMVSVTQDNDMAMGAAVAGAKILEKYIMEGPSEGALAAVADTIANAEADYMKEAIAAKDTNHREAVALFGSSCTLPDSFKSVVHCLATSNGDFAQTIRAGLIAGGDNCSRMCFVGAVLGATVGVDGIPEVWRSKTDKASKALELAEMLVSYRTQ